jgi:GntR family transcriptional regulator
MTQAEKLPSAIAALKTPLYHQIALILRQQIVDGYYAYDDRVPTEKELTERYEVSRITAKRALDDLAKEGLVVRERARGTRVCFKGAIQPVKSSVEGVLENLLSMGLETEVTLLSFEYVTPTDALMESLECEKDTLVQKAVRIRSLEGEPFSYLITHVPEDIGQQYDQNELAEKPLLALLERSGVKVASANQTISASLADAVVASALNVEIGAALLAINRVVRDQNGRPVEHISALYRPDRYQYHMELTRIRGEGENTWSPQS